MFNSLEINILEVNMEVGEDAIEVRPLSAEEVVSMLPSMELEEWATTKQDLVIMTSCAPGAFIGAIHKRTKRVIGKKTQQ